MNCNRTTTLPSYRRCTADKVIAASLSLFNAFLFRFIVWKNKNDGISMEITLFFRNVKIRNRIKKAFKNTSRRKKRVTPKKGCEIINKIETEFIEKFVAKRSYFLETLLCGRLRSLGMKLKNLPDENKNISRWQRKKRLILFRLVTRRRLESHGLARLEHQRAHFALETRRGGRHGNDPVQRHGNDPVVYMSKRRKLIIENTLSYHHSIEYKKINEK